MKPVHPGGARRVNHIGIVVRDLPAALVVWHEIMGLALEGERDLPERGMRVAFLRAGETMIELLAPTREDSEVSRFLEKKGEGVHHVCLETDDVEAFMERVRARGLSPIGPGPSQGAEGFPVQFLHPRSTRGVLVEWLGGSVDSTWTGDQGLTPRGTAR